MDIHPLKTEADYEAALAEIKRLFDAVPNTPAGDRLDRLTTLVEAYDLTFAQNRGDQNYENWSPSGILSGI